jgi:hypothetical protein
VLADDGSSRLQPRIEVRAFAGLLPHPGTGVPSSHDPTPLGIETFVLDFTEHEQWVWRTSRLTVNAMTTNSLADWIMCRHVERAYGSTA